MALVSEFDGFIFDYGGVLVFDQRPADVQRMAQLLGVDTEQFSELYWADRLEYDRGIETGAEYWFKLAQRAGKVPGPGTIDSLIEADNASWMRFDQVMWDWIAQLRAAGKPVAILSNMPRDLGEALHSRTDRLASFDQVTLSYEVNSVKPEPAIYEHCLDGIGTAPEKTLFLDDRIANVHGAELLGIRAIRFTSSEEILLRLRS